MATERRFNAGTCYETPRSFPKYLDDKNFRVLSWEEWRSWQENGYLVTVSYTHLTLPTNREE